MNKCFPAWNKPRSSHHWSSKRDHKGLRRCTDCGKREIKTDKGVTDQFSEQAALYRGATVLYFLGKEDN